MANGLPLSRAARGRISSRAGCPVHLQKVYPIRPSAAERIHQRREGHRVVRGQPERAHRAARPRHRRHQGGDDGRGQDPHTMVFDGKGHIWFITPFDSPSNPYGIVIDAKGTLWVALLRVGMVAKIDPRTMAVTRFKEGQRRRGRGPIGSIGRRSGVDGTPVLRAVPPQQRRRSRTSLI